MSTRTIKMEKDGLSADVHPDELDNYRAGGWTESQAGSKKKAAKKPAAPAASDAAVTSSD